MAEDIRFRDSHFLHQKQAKTRLGSDIKRLTKNGADYSVPFLKITKKMPQDWEEKVLGCNTASSQQTFLRRRE